MADPLLKYVMKKDKKEEIFHTSTYGRAQSGTGFGATSSQSYNARMMIEQNRRIVKGYGDAGLVNKARSNSGQRAKTYTPPKDTGLRKAGGGIRAGGPGTIAKKD